MVYREAHGEGQYLTAANGTKADGTVIKYEGGLKTIKGLGRKWSWKELVGSQEPSQFCDVPSDLCIDCFDGAPP